MNSILPPTGTLIRVQVAGLEGLLQTGTGRCGPAPLIGNPRSESAPPVKNRSLSGTSLPENGVANPKRMLVAHTREDLTGT